MTKNHRCSVRLTDTDIIKIQEIINKMEHRISISAYLRDAATKQIEKDKTQYLSSFDAETT